MENVGVVKKTKRVRAVGDTEELEERVADNDNSLFIRIIRRIRAHSSPYVVDVGGYGLIPLRKSTILSSRPKTEATRYSTRDNV